MRFLAFLTSALLISYSCFANENVSPEGYFGVWRVYTAKEGTETLCFMVAAPQHTSSEREENFLSITHRPYENSFDTIALMFGTSFHKTSRPTIEVDNHKPIEMKTSDDSAFVMNEKDEKTLIDQMIIGNVARTKGKSHKKNVLRETFSLKGFAKAYEMLNEKCPREQGQTTNAVSQITEQMPQKEETLPLSNETGGEKK
ncbi:MAG: hypothetical protein J6V53_06970 [Alphaproteobacteria bacterium]|nr:hypothetical protein [Alphaproteobacteria bacterium]